MKREGTQALTHAAIYFLARGLPGIIAFIAIPLFTRLLDPAAYGRYALAMATVLLCNALGFQWLRLSLVRFLPAHKDDPTKLKSTLLTAALMLVGVAAIIAAILSFVPGLGEWHSVIWPCWIVLAMQSVFDLFCEHMRAQIEPWQFMILQLARTSISVGLGAALIVGGLGWYGPLIALAVAMLVPAAYAYWRDWTDARLMLDRATLGAIARYGIPLSATVALAVVIGSSDRFLIASMLGESSAGLYSVAVDLTSQTLTLLMLVINMAMFPLAVRAYEEGGVQAAANQMRHNAALLLGVGVPATVALAVLAPSISHTFLGEGFRDAAVGIIPMVALGTFLAGYKAYQLDSAFQFAHRTIHQVWIVLIAAVVNIALNVIMIKPFGIQGAAAASVIAYVISMVLTAWVGRRHFPLPFPVAAAGQVLVAAAAMTLVLWPMRTHVGAAAIAMQVVAGGLTYGVVLIGMNFLELRTALLAKLSAPAEE